MEEFFKMVSNYGFPIVVAGYLLFRQEQKMQQINDSINGRNGILDKIEDISKVIKDCCRRQK